MPKLKKSEKFAGVEGPVVTIVMDGIGLAPEGPRWPTHRRWICS